MSMWKIYELGDVCLSFLVCHAAQAVSSPQLFLGSAGQKSKSMAEPDRQRDVVTRLKHVGIKLHGLYGFV